ncbi:hypothetical protein AXF42_Ash001882 [Apostasia shenzhenica]|uniref:Uncharacterized protein n=1 Tax=Apostasia shenzhenica TaxID=1088818 RepID=A0A2I0ABH3_9ASPA|nr:hypothetical protein AXF42_Ash001882 [Apostasia shenzhenica]
MKPLCTESFASVDILCQAASLYTGDNAGVIFNPKGEMKGIAMSIDFCFGDRSKSHDTISPSCRHTPIPQMLIMARSSAITADPLERNVLTCGPGSPALPMPSSINEMDGCDDARPAKHLPSSLVPTPERAAGGSGCLPEEADHDGAATTPVAEENRLKAGEVCPPAPRKRRPAKRKPPPEREFCKVPRDLGLVFHDLARKKVATDLQSYFVRSITNRIEVKPDEKVVNIARKFELFECEIRPIYR